MTSYRICTNQFNKIDLIILSTLLLLLSMAILLIYNNNIIVNVKAQLLLPGPPLSSSNIPDTRDKENSIQNKQFLAEFQPPEIEFLTKVLSEGKNVIKINVSSEVEIDYCKIIFTKEQTKKTIDCVQDKGSIYKGLIDAKPPSQRVEVHARDVYGDSTYSIETIKVAVTPSFQSQIWNLFHGLLSSLS
jgi:hypothetical protein